MVWAVFAALAGAGSKWVAHWCLWERALEYITVSEFVGEFAFLSADYPCQLTHKGISYPSVQHGYQHLKTNDPDWQRRIREAPTAQEAWLLGRQAPLTTPDWPKTRVAIMSNLNLAKFSQNKELSEKLLATGDWYLYQGYRPLVETDEDVFWGVDLTTGEGHNVMGEVLVTLRRFLFRKQP